MAVILVGIGANLPGPDGSGPRDTCDWAVAQLAAQPGLSLVARSSWYRSAPVPPSGQPDYVNGVVRLQGEAAPAALLQLLHALEARAGRQRSVANAARTLDLDLLAAGDAVCDGAALVLPHPRLHQRGFVLLPLLEVAPDWVHPRLGLGVPAMLAAVDTAGVERLD